MTFGRVSVGDEDGVVRAVEGVAIGHLGVISLRACEETGRQRVSFKFQVSLTEAQDQILHMPYDDPWVLPWYVPLYKK